jgi:hypothetical protein
MPRGGARAGAGRPKTGSTITKATIYKKDAAQGSSRDTRSHPA